MFKNLLHKEIERKIAEMFGTAAARGEFSVEACDPDLRRGDFATNAAFAFAKELGKNPREVAEEIKEKLEKAKMEETGETEGAGETMKFVEKIEIAGAGFINFYLKPKVFVEHIAEIARLGEKYGQNEAFTSQKVIIEYTDPNIFKEFHIGHLVGNTVGESLSRLVEWGGAETKRANYQGDAGMHIAKAVWSILKECRDIKTDADLGAAYAAGAKAYESDENTKKEIAEINKKIYDKSDEKINEIYERGKKISLDAFEIMYKKLGTRFDYYFFESEAGPIGRKIVREELKKGVFEEGENGAIIYPGEKYDLHTRVFINSEGLPTYEAKELGLVQLKYKKFHYDRSLIVAGSELAGYAPVMKSAIEKTFLSIISATGDIFPYPEGYIRYVLHGMLRLPEGKMSSRNGNVITAGRLIDEVEKRVLEKISERELSEREKGRIAQAVAIGAIKFSILRGSTGKDIIFDFEKSISFEGDSGPYLQYTLARAFSVLRKGQEQGVAPNTQNAMFENSHLEKLLFERFPETLERAAREYEPHHICTYLLELASAFNSYYAQNQIVKHEDAKQSSYRLALTQAVAIILKNGLTVLGMPVLEKM